MNPISDLIPSVHNWFEFVVAIAFIGSQAWQFWILNRIKTQTNGLVASSVKAAGEAGTAKGEAMGAQKEQARVAAKLILSDAVEAAKTELADRVEAAKLALANEVAAHLQELKRHD